MMVFKKIIHNKRLIEIIKKGLRLSFTVSIIIFVLFLIKILSFTLLEFIILFVICFIIAPIMFTCIVYVLDQLIGNSYNKKIQKYTEGFPNNCYIDKINNDYFIKPLPFLSNHEKLKITKEIEEKNYKIHPFIKGHLDDQAGYGARYFCLRINDKIYMAGSYPDLKYGNIENYEEF